MKSYFNTKIRKLQGLFDTLVPVFQVRYENPDSVILLTVEANTVEEAKAKALQNKEFTDLIVLEQYSEKHLYAYKPEGLYVVGKIEFLTDGKW